FQAEDGIRDLIVTGVQTCALPISPEGRRRDHVDRRTEARQPVARDADPAVVRDGRNGVDRDPAQAEAYEPDLEGSRARRPLLPQDRKSTRLNSSHDQISYAVFCLK